jgi:signal transduction histidine kinase
VQLVRTGTFRLSAIAAASFTVATLLLFGFIYWQSARIETARIERFVQNEAASLAHESTADLERDIDRRYARDIRRPTFAAIFDAAGHRVVGSLAEVPPGLPADATIHRVEAAHEVGNAVVREPSLVAAQRLPDGRLLVVGRGEDELAQMRLVVLQALDLGVLPAILIALGVGAYLGQRTRARIAGMNSAIARIMAGNIGERLPARIGSDEIDHLALSVNQMLDEIERLLHEAKAVGDDIAHDLRTPLTRLRSRLEGGQARAKSQMELSAVVDEGLADLDKAMQIITALLRLGEIANTGRRAGFGEVSLGAIVREVADFYQPLAEEKQLELSAQVEPAEMVHGDRDLLFEAVANLADNAVKFTPAGGRVVLSLEPAPCGARIRVADSGPGIPTRDRPAMLRRFHRADGSRHAPGNGLGLSIVSAIARLHGFTLEMGEETPGFHIDILCPGVHSA